MIGTVSIDPVIRTMEYTPADAAADRKFCEDYRAGRIQTLVAPNCSMLDQPYNPATGQVGVPVNPGHIELDTISAIGWNNGPIMWMNGAAIAGALLLGYILFSGDK